MSSKEVDYNLYIFLFPQDPESTKQKLINNTEMNHQMNGTEDGQKSKDFSKVTVVVDFEPHDEVVRHRITLCNNVEKLL